MNIQEIKTIIMKELPYIMQTDEEVRRFIISIGREQFADKDESARRFDRIMDELAEQRKQSDRKWEAHHKEWEEHRKEWKAYRKETDSKWEEHRKEWEAYRKEADRKWEEYRKESDSKWKECLKESARKWDEHRKEHEILIKRIEQSNKSTIGALGARWGIFSEESFRNGLKGILEENFDVEVMNITDYDHDGIVFGRPDQIELDIIIKNGLLIICELKSSMSKSDMYAFERKVRFYEKKHGKKASKMIVISPMVDDRAKPVADKLGIVVYSGSYDVKSL